MLSFYVDHINIYLYVYKYKLRVVQLEKQKLNRKSALKMHAFVNSKSYLILKKGARKVNIIEGPVNRLVGVRVRVSLHPVHTIVGHLLGEVL